MKIFLDPKVAAELGVRRTVDAKGGVRSNRPSAAYVFYRTLDGRSFVTHDEPGGPDEQRRLAAYVSGHRQDYAVEMIRLWQSEGFQAAA